MRLRITALAVATLVLSAMSSQLRADMSEEAFEQLRTLVGEWSGTLERSTGEKIPLKLTYTVRANGSAVVEESDENGVEMLNIFNKQEGVLLSTHYCGLMNKPVSTLVSVTDGVLSFTTDAARSGLQEGRDEYVRSWRLSLKPENPDQFIYEYTVLRRDMTEQTAKAIVSRVK